MNTTERRFEIRPVQLEEWLDALPYANVQETCQRLEYALNQTNQQTLKPGARWGLLALYMRPYHYLLKTHGRTNSADLRGVQAHQEQINSLRKITAELAIGSSSVVRAILDTESTWRRKRPPIQAMLLAVRLFSHLLLLNFQSYTATSKSVWREIHSLYRTAETLACQDLDVEDLADEGSNKTSIHQAYGAIMATAMVDPLHLPPNLVWDVFEQVESWSTGVSIRSCGNDEVGEHLFVIDLKRGAHPIPYKKYNKAMITDHHRLLDCGSLNSKAQNKLITLQQNADPQTARQFADRRREFLLEQMVAAWGQPYSRSHPRREHSGRVEICFGINTTFYCLNGEKEFAPPTAGEQDHNEAQHFSPDEFLYSTELWEFTNQAAAGYQVFRQERPVTPLRVGDIIGTRLQTNVANPPWSLCLVRWLMLEKHNHHKIGIEIIGADVQPAAIRAKTGRKMETDFRRAFIVNTPAREKVLVTTTGLYYAGCELEVNQNCKTVPVVAKALLESTLVIEMFSIAF